ncbi:MAG TPA: tRNA (adenosine(37)-N6)-threonylcarbamoyltransferase complex transferase subunit TsaD [Tepidisphaeraceae bacterium]|nr:tRNA (adenosine(37)-N6)-threonylcarbamoyltransferase complex transferase subunit TsaD [Tepidisphaeraceae bacterium]
MPSILGIESTCDETAAAVVEDGVRVRSNIVATQTALHAKYRGVVPEIASRAHLENINPVIEESLSAAGASWDRIDAIAVAHRPGLIGSLLIGVTAAKTLAWCIGKPLIGVDHVHAHLYSVRLQSGIDPPMPAVGLVCSGGHTALYRLNSMLDAELVGTTLDDAVGEAYDKVSAILGLGYPGGPILDGLARRGDPSSIRFPRALLDHDSLDFSFSGLKTAVLYHVRGRQGRERTVAELSQQQISDVAAAFQAACVDVLCEKIRRAVERFAARCVIIGGGVSANRGLRQAMEKFPVPVFFPPLEFCTDNAAMIAGLADLLLAAGRTSELDLDAITYSQWTA